MEQVVEVLLKKKTTLKDRVKVVLLSFMVVVADVFCLLFTRIGLMLLPVLVILSCVAIYYIVKYNDIEFEYILVNDELDIDKIMGKSKRKKLVTVKRTQIVSYERVTASNYETYRKQSSRVIMAASSENNINNYYIALADNRKTVVILDENDNIYKALRKK